MSRKREPITYKGRSLGIIALSGAQLFIGVIHVIVGVTLLASKMWIDQTNLAYDVYTVAFGILVVVFAAFIWRGETAGWVGTIAALLFVTVADALTLLNLPSISGIPTFAAPTEIAYSIIVITYMALPHVRKKFLA
jgi:hypothetical protein